MNKYFFINAKRFFFFLVSSFSLALIGYYLLFFIMPGHYVFGALYRMFLYHWAFPVPFIFLVCLIYSFVALPFSKPFLRTKTPGRIALTAMIVLTTIFLASPLGGVIYYYIDMLAGFFPDNWLRHLIDQGFKDGFSLGWLIILLSFPYNILGTIACYFVTKKGAALFDSPE